MNCRAAENSHAPVPLLYVTYGLPSRSNSPEPPPGWQAPQAWVKKMEVLSIWENAALSVVPVVVFRANWLESEEGGHHFPYIPAERIHGLAGLYVSDTVIVPAASVRPCWK